jgi:hypothetical protein
MVASSLCTFVGREGKWEWMVPCQPIYADAPLLEEKNLKGSCASHSLRVERDEASRTSAETEEACGRTDSEKHDSFLCSVGGHGPPGPPARGCAK